MAIADNLNRIIQAKADIKTAIENKGVSVGDITIDGYAAKIAEIKGGDALIKLPSTLTFNGGTVTGDFDMGQWDWSDINYWGYMFYNQTNLTSLINFPTDIQPTTMNNMFNSCSNLISIDVFNWDTSNVTNMENMFYNCSNLTSIDVSNWDTSNVTNMENMFYGCSNLTSIDVSNWDTSNVTNMENMFFDCYNLTEVKMGGNVSKVTNVSNMFGYNTTTGTFYYNSNYDYSKIIAVLPSTWTAVPLE